MPIKTTATLGDVQHATLRNLLGTFCAGKAGFSIDANANDVETDNAFDYFIKGVGYTNAADTAIDISAEIDLSNIAVLPAGYTGVFVFEVDASGGYTVVAGDYVPTADITAGTKTANWPTPSSDDVCAFGAVKVAATADFTLGTTALTTIGTFYDICRVPANF